MARSDSQTNKPQCGCPKKNRAVGCDTKYKHRRTSNLYIVGAQVAEWLAHWPLANVA